MRQNDRTRPRLIRLGIILFLFALGACGGEDPLPVEPPLGPQVPCLDACTAACTDGQGAVDEECIIPCVTACFTPDAG